MKFWDSSALVPLVLDEPSTDEMHALIREDPDVIVSFITPLEVESAIWRRVRLTPEDRARAEAQERLRALDRDWILVDDIDRTLTEAHALVKRYHLRAADAIQLGAAILVGRDLSFVTRDEELKVAARAEGFTVAV